MACLLGASGAHAGPPILYTFDCERLRAMDLTDPRSRRAAWDELQVVTSLQGIVNRRSPRLYIHLVGDHGKIDRYWLGRLREPGEWLAARRLQPVATVDELVTLFRRDIRGAVVWDERVPATATVASTAAGVEDAVAVRYDPTPGSLYDRLVASPGGLRLPVRVRLLREDNSLLFTGSGTIPDTQLASTGSAKCDAHLWAVERYLKSGRCDPTRLAYYPNAWWLTRTGGGIERTLLSNHDYFIARRGFFFDLSPWDDESPDDDLGAPKGADERTLRTVLHAAYDASHGRMIQVGGFPPWDQKYTDYTGRKHGGVETEWRYAEILSCFNAFMDADAPGLDAMANASLFCRYPLTSRYPQRNLPTDQDLRTKGWLQSDGSVAPRAYVAIYVGDYDSAAWLYQRIPDLWDDPARGSVPLGWAFNPTLAERFPVGLAYTRRTASANDTFIAGDSGAGYLNPGFLEPPRKWSGLPSGLAVWEEHCLRYYRRWDLRVTGFVIDGFAPPMNDATLRAYARFSPGGVVAQKVPETSLVDGVPFLRMTLDIDGDARGGAQAIASHTSRQGVSFGIYRTIMWSPTAQRELIDRLRERRPDIQVVDPHALLALLRHHLEHKHHPENRK
jgi:hypothetical protein